MRKTITYTPELTKPSKRIVIKYIPSVYNYFVVFYTLKNDKRIGQFIRHNTMQEIAEEGDACVICPRCDVPFQSVKIFKMHYQFNHMRKQDDSTISG